MGRGDGGDHPEEVYLQRQVDSLQADKAQLERDLAVLRALIEEGYPIRWQQALGRAGELLELPDGSSLADDIPQAVEKLVTAGKQNLELLGELREAAAHYWENAKRGFPLEQAAKDRLWSVMDKIRGVLGPLRKEQDNGVGRTVP